MDKKIIKNSSYLLSAQTFTKVTSFLYVVFLLRNLSIDNFGIYAAAAAYFSLFSAISEFGINRYLIREVAKNKLKTDQLFSQVLIFRLVFFAIVFILFSLSTYFFDPLRLRAVLTILAITAVFPQIISFTIDSILVANERFDLSAKALLVLNLANVIIGLIAVSLGQDIFGVILALFSSQLIYALVLFFYLQKFGNQKLSFGKLTDLKVVIVESLPYGFLSILGLLYFRVDTLILSYLKGPFDTGVYGAGYKFLEAVVFIPSAISSVLFPLFARLSEQHPGVIYKLYKKSLKVNLAIGFLILLGYWTILPLVIEIFMPKFISSIPVIKILALTIPFLFMISSQSVVLLSNQHYLKRLIVISIFNLALNIILNFFFVPQFGYLAASWITVFSDIIGFLIFFVVIKSVFKDEY